jgi:hypothetical protein
MPLMAVQWTTLDATNGLGSLGGLTQAVFGVTLGACMTLVAGVTLEGWTFKVTLGATVMAGLSLMARA